MNWLDDRTFFDVMKRIGDPRLAGVAARSLTLLVFARNMSGMEMPFDGKRMFWGGFEMILNE